MGPGPGDLAEVVEGETVMMVGQNSNSKTTATTTTPKLDFLEPHPIVPTSTFPFTLDPF